MIQSATGSSLASIEQKIDAEGKPQSRELTGWRITGETNLIRTKTPARNVLAELEGDGPHADETIVIGAHYDHLGYGGFGSLAPQAGHVIHPGADDNASGTAALLEVARQFVGTGEDQKIPAAILVHVVHRRRTRAVGQRRYVRDPLIPLDKTIAMLNMDMVGRMKDNKLTVYGIDTATEFAPLVTRLNQPYGFKIIPEAGRLWPERSCVVFREEDSGAVLLHRPAFRLSSPDRHGRQARRARHAPRRRSDDRRGGGDCRGSGKAALLRIASEDRRIRRNKAATGPISAASPISASNRPAATRSRA